MNTRIKPFLLLISFLLISGCTSQKAKVFGDDMPSMKTLHDEKFHVSKEGALKHPSRPVSDNTVSSSSSFQWLPNPTLYLYVFEHLSPTGLPVPGYTTFFKFYTTDHIALPSEQSVWAQ